MNHATVKIAATVAATAAALGVGPEGAAALRHADADRDRFDFYVGKHKVLRLVGSFDDAAGRLTITPK